MNIARLLGEDGAAGPLIVAAVTSLVATALSYGLPEQYAATGVGLWFLFVVFVLVLRRGDSATVRRMGLSLGGLFEPEVPIEFPRVLAAGGRALAIGVLLAAVVLPPFWVGYVYWYQPRGAFTPAPWPSLQNDVLGQLLGVAFPEEAFFRGYLQSSLDTAWPPGRRLFGAPVGRSIWVTSAIFAVGHLLTEPYPGRLAVFFPSLLFGFL
ncbi:MAG TPA: MrtC family glutamic-type intramembrane protease, partial [Polyangiaceae bacterium]|nr:MrtC family glutamic-type intramembrane protease [Polyangiaceae bacterium]